MLNLKMLSLQYLFNILVKYLLNDQYEYILIIYIKRGVEKCPRLSFYVPWKPRKSKNKSVYSFAAHPVFIDLWCHTSASCPSASGPAWYIKHCYLHFASTSFIKQKVVYQKVMLTKKECQPKSNVKCVATSTYTLVVIKNA